MVLTMDKFGRVLIPKTARKSLRLEAGSEIELVVNEGAGTAELKPKHKKDEVPDYIKYTDWGWPYLAIDVEFPEDFDNVAFMKETRQEYLDRKMGL